MLKTKIIEETIYNLSDLLEELQMVVKSTFDRTYWVIAEIVSVSEAKNGHMYFEIAEKNQDFLQAKIRANLWSGTKKRILSEFEHITNQSLKKGMKVLLNVTIEFHTVYGISLNILDIDTNFSLGEIERQKQATLLQLEEEGLLDFNKQHVLPHVIQNIAIISSKTAAGYQDFIKQLHDNPHKYSFQTTLFQATMQGEKAAESIILAHDKINTSKTNFDVIVLIRGGGSSLDLSCFDEYALAAHIAQSYYPVLTGIGHERDTSICDIVAHTQLKTPTAVAEFIISHNSSFEQNLDLLNNQLQSFAQDLIAKNQQALVQYGKRLNYNAQNIIHYHSKNIIQNGFQYQVAVKARLSKAEFRLSRIKYIMEHELKNKILQKQHYLHSRIEKLDVNSLKLLISNQQTVEKRKATIIDKTSTNLLKNKSNIHQIEQLIHLVDPKQILKKGFSITRINGKVIKMISDIEKHSLIETELYDGVLESKIIKSKTNE